MNRLFLRTNIIEEMERARYLKTLFPRPIPIEVSSLADRCNRILDENIDFLSVLLNELDQRPENGDLRDLFRAYRDVYRVVELVEYYGIPALQFRSADSNFLNRLLYKIQTEINLPFLAPCVACFSNRYYWIEGRTNVLFMPVGEASSLLHLPDIFHELGHATLFNKENDNRLQKIKSTYQDIVDVITSHYENEITQKSGRTMPKKVPEILRHLHWQWKSKWLDEFFSDLFACYTLGPAYVWAHLHLVAKMSHDVYLFEPVPIPQTHPSDDSRMKMLHIALEMNRFKKEGNEIMDVWSSMPFVSSTTPIPEYKYAYPEELMKKIALLTLEGMKNSGFEIITPEILGKMNSSNIRKILNNSWMEFWKNSNYFEWEKDILKELKSTI